jgi:hypothetical protein
LLAAAITRRGGGAGGGGRGGGGAGGRQGSRWIGGAEDGMTKGCTSSASGGHDNTWRADKRRRSDAPLGTGRGRERETSQPQACRHKHERYILMDHHNDIKYHYTIIIIIIIYYIYYGIYNLCVYVV